MKVIAGSILLAAANLVLYFLTWNLSSSALVRGYMKWVEGLMVTNGEAYHVGLLVSMAGLPFLVSIVSIYFFYRIFKSPGGFKGKIIGVVVVYVVSILIGALSVLVLGIIN